MKPKDARKPKPRDGRIKHVSIDAFVERTARLIDLEKEAEKEQSLASLAGKSEDGIKRLLERGRALRGLVISSVEGGLLGNSLVTLEKRASNESDKALPAHKFHPHDIVACKPSKGDASSEVILQGIVYRVKESSITLVCENIDDDKDLSQSVRIEKLSNDVTFTRLKTTLDRLAKVHSGGARASESWRMVDCIFGSSLPAFSKTLSSGGATASDLVFFSPTLDDSQKSAVSHALRAQDLVMVHGPPGTGKTTTVVEIVLQEAINRKQRVLVCSASNVAVDNLVERIQTKVHDLSSAKGKKLKIVRLGHPARLLPQVLGVCLDSLVLRTDSTELADDCVKEVSCRENWPPLLLRVHSLTHFLSPPPSHSLSASLLWLFLTDQGDQPAPAKAEAPRAAGKEAAAVRSQVSEQGSPAEAPESYYRGLGESARRGLHLDRLHDAED